MDKPGPDDSPTLIRRVVIATDGSEGSRVAADLGAAMAERFGAEIFIVHAVNLPSAYSLGVYPPPSEVDQALQRSGEHALKAAAEVVEGHGLAHTDVIAHGAPANVILDAAEAHEADLIVMGSQGLGAVQRFLLGSVTTRVLHNAPCAVLVAPAPRDT